MEKKTIGEVITKVAEATVSRCKIISKPEKPPRDVRKAYPDIKINRPFEALRGVKIK